MTDDGTIDYSQFTRVQLVDALSRIDRSRFPRNFEALNCELNARGPEPDIQARDSEPSLLALAGRYALTMVALQVLFGVLHGFGQAALSGRFADTSAPESSVSLSIRFVATLAIAFAVFAHLAKHHRLRFTKAGPWVAILVGLLSPVLGYFDPHVKPYRPVLLLVVSLGANFGLMYLAGWVTGVFRRNAGRVAWVEVRISTKRERLRYGRPLPSASVRPKCSRGSRESVSCIAV
jgi:hypothetical protein